MTKKVLYSKELISESVVYETNHVNPNMILDLNKNYINLYLKFLYLAHMYYKPHLEFTTDYHDQTLDELINFDNIELKKMLWNYRNKLEEHFEKDIIIVANHLYSREISRLLVICYIRDGEKAKILEYFVEQDMYKLTYGGQM